MQYFNIQVASQISGVASATIRAWEKRYNAVIPERAENKHRLYSELDIEKLTLLYKLTEFGQSIGKIAHLDIDELKRIYFEVFHRPFEHRNQIFSEDKEIDPSVILSKLELALDAYKLDIISHELEKTQTDLSSRSLSLKILAPFCESIKERIAKKTLSRIQELTLSALCLSQIGQNIAQGPHHLSDDRALFLIATPENGIHQISILGASLLCIHYNINFLYLGTDVPALSLTETANAMKPSAVILVAADDQYLETLHKNLKVDLNVLRFPKLANLDQYLLKIRRYWQS